MSEIKINLFSTYKKTEVAKPLEYSDIILNNVTVNFRLSNEKVDSLKDYMIRLVRNKLKYTEFRALDSINMRIKRGERVGIIGHNGAGKSTLLKVISGVLKPTNGQVHVSGSVAPLLELGAGFDEEFSGMDNIYLNGAILGKSKAYLDSKLKVIIDFSELESFIHHPVKNYSSGMRAKLGFAIATHLESDIVIIDEILSVGDENFKIKSEKKIADIVNSGKTLLLVSHSIEKIKALTDKVIWMEKGKIILVGSSKEVCDSYLKYIHGEHSDGLVHQQGT
ncbi:ABC-2 type transport system ATP-binding protein [Paenibacillus sp. 4624]|uniref:ABC transporter ATP-binding protein n=1 Tax=Paenibacillus sp. 4624 TaxID=3156453 RepID=UPI003D24D325